MPKGLPPKETAQGTFVGPSLERTKVDDLATMFVRDYRINGRKSLAVDVTSEQLARYVDKR
ncbi:MAG TPA: hypothetical protein VHW45_12615 [Candidatus Sulfotelmatobacter sp.]|jgi:hypothetical protein|nr:hypothetical protein [Candidatus Sulfotelmatobacter sp.]